VTRHLSFGDSTPLNFRSVLRRRNPSLIVGSPDR